MPLTEQQVVGLLDKSVSAFNAKKADYFDAFAPDVVVFTPDRQDAVKGIDAFKQQFQPLITGDSEEKVQNRSVQILGDKAVVTQNVQLMLPNSTLNLRQTLIVGDTPQGPRIVHFQSAPLNPANMAAVSVVNNRIATVAPVLGVAQ
jgi:ketosteroid isomerase-like protein